MYIYIYTCTWNFFMHLKGHTCTCSHSCTEDIKIYYYRQYWRNQLNVRVLIAMIFVYLDFMYHMLFWETEREKAREREIEHKRERKRGEREGIFLSFKKQSVLLKKLIKQFKTGTMQKANSLFRSFTYHNKHASLYLKYMQYVLVLTVVYLLIDIFDINGIYFYMYFYKIFKHGLVYECISWSTLQGILNTWKQFLVS